MKRSRPYLTKVWIGKHWWYMHTKRRFWRTGHHYGIVSYRRRAS